MITADLFRLDNGTRYLQKPPLQWVKARPIHQDAVELHELPALVQVQGRPQRVPCRGFQLLTPWRIMLMREML